MTSRGGTAPRILGEAAFAAAFFSFSIVAIISIPNAIPAKHTSSPLTNDSQIPRALVVIPQGTTQSGGRMLRDGGNGTQDSASPGAFANRRPTKQRRICYPKLSRVTRLLRDEDVRDQPGKNAKGATNTM